MALYSPRHLFLFTHVYRTGGNSMRALITTPDSFQVGSPHALPDDVREFMSEAAWQGAFRFTVVRHPYTWLGSTWDFVRRIPTHREHDCASDGFSEYVRWIADAGLAQHHGALQDRHAKLVDFARHQDHVYRFEDHPQPMLDVCERLGLPTPRDIPHRNRSSAVVVPDAETKAFIQRVWAADFERFGYDG
jgi:hypothetical protein